MEVVLSSEQVESNKREILELLNTVERSGIDKLIKYLEISDFFQAPASTKFHLNCEGGLAHHSLNVYKCLLADSEGVISKDTCILAGLLHDICKLGVYKKVKKSIKIGTMVNDYGKTVNQWDEIDVYEFDDPAPLGHGEKSVFVLMQFIRLSLVEIAMIRWHMGPPKDDTWGEFYKACDKWPEVMLMHNADMKATYLVEKKSDITAK